MCVLAEHRGAVLLITLNRPDRRNALNAAAISGLGRALTEAESDPAVSVVVLTGSGTQAFCAGIDLKEFAAKGGSPAPRDAPGLEVMLRRVYPKPLIAAANGTAVGGGFELILACDIIIAAEHARFGLPEVKRGLVASGCGIELLPRRLPLSIALEIGLTGEPIDAPRAAALGLVNRVVPGDRVLSEAMRYAELIAANAPLAVRCTKRHMRRIGDGEQADAARREYREEADRVLGSEDALEGATAFAEHRAPVWRGR